MKRLLLAGLLAVSSLAVFGTGSAQAAILDAPVPTNAYITKGGYDIAWAAPCAPVQPSCGPIDLTYQSQFGWQIMSAQLFNQLGITVFDFVMQGANVDYFTGNNYDEVSGATLQALASPFPQGDVAVASPYFSTTHWHADWVDGLNSLWAPIDSGALSESLVVRLNQSHPTPEPSTLLLLGGGMAGLGLAAWRKRKQA